MVVAPTCDTCVNDSLQWVLVCAELVALAVVAPRLVRAARGGQVLVADIREAPAGNISVVIPARNEAQRLAECIEPLRGAPGVREVIVVDDQSSDATADIAREHGANVVRGAPLPPGWVGKIWALQQGIEAATGDVIVTLDADARPSSSLPSAAVAALQRSGAVLGTVAPRFRTTSNAAQWLHAAMLTSLVYRHAAGSGRADASSVANGQCMVFRRDDAVRDDWCGSVRGEIIEDVALVRRLAREGKPVEMFDGARLLTVQMFDGFADTWRGWGRSLALPGIDRPIRQWCDAAVTMLVLVWPLWSFVFGFASVATAMLLLVRLGTLMGTVRAFERPRIGYWLSPFADLLAWLVVARGIVAPSREWRGRTY